MFNKKPLQKRIQKRSNTRLEPRPPGWMLTTLTTKLFLRWISVDFGKTVPRTVFPEISNTDCYRNQSIKHKTVTVPYRKVTVNRRFGKPLSTSDLNIELNGMKINAAKI